MNTQEKKPLIILVDHGVEAAMKNLDIELVQVFGSESIVDDNGRTLARGNSAYVTGTAEAFRQLVTEAGGLWTTTNPMLGSWKQYVPDDEQDDSTVDVVRVKFEMSEETWNTVVVEGMAAGENFVTTEESTDNFIAEYDTRDDFEKAIGRFDGMIQYTELK